LRAVQDARVRDRELRVQALRAAKSACLNIAEGAGRVTRADKARAYTVARGELIEAIAAIEIAHESGDARGEAVSRVLAFGPELYAVPQRYSSRRRRRRGERTQNLRAVCFSATTDAVRVPLTNSVATVLIAQARVGRFLTREPHLLVTIRPIRGAQQPGAAVVVRRALC
jgi:four helix bundle protein